MLRHRNIDRVCCLALAVTLLITCVFLAAAADGRIQRHTGLGYEERLFDTSRVHTIDIILHDWEGFLATCVNEEYVSCTVVIDGESYKNVALRAKGNTSLSSVASYGNNRYSFKIEFDHYQSGSTYYGLDKLSLNNTIQDATSMKDYLAYTLMGKMGVAAPLCSYAWINVNGESWGLYLAVECVENAFLRRNYGRASGALYKPDSMSFGGGRGNGRDFDMSELDEKWAKTRRNSFDPSERTDGTQSPEGMSFPNPPGQDGLQPPGGDFVPSSPLDASGEWGPADLGGRDGFDGGMGSDDVKLIYTDDNPESYANIFNNAKTDISSADQERLIAALKALNEGDAGVVDADQVLRYLAVHNFLCNGDSYTGSMVHNYYLYEDNGVLAMIPWDYNLAFGTFGRNGETATEAVNSPIDSPVSSGTLSSRPMIAWIFESEETLERYHAVYQEFMETVFDSGWFEREVDRVYALIAPYVADDPTAFYSYAEFEKGVSALRLFCQKRAESIRGQLAGTIPSTSEGQKNSDALIDAAELVLSDMGGMEGQGGEKQGGQRKERVMFPGFSGERNADFPSENAPPADRKNANPENIQLLAASVAVLAAALLIARRVKSHL